MLPVLAVPLLAPMSTGEMSLTTCMFSTPEAGDVFPNWSVATAVIACGPTPSAGLLALTPRVLFE